MNARTPSLCFVLLALAVLAAAPAASATTVTPEDVRSELERFVRDRLPASVVEVAVADLSLTEGIPVDGEADLRFRPRANENFVGRCSMVMDVVVGNRAVESRNISFRVCGQVAVWTVAVPVRRGERVDTSLLTADLRDLDSLPSDTVLQEEPLDRVEAARSLSVGSVLCLSMLRRMPDRQRGASARIVMTNGVLTVSCTGEMMEDGFIGEYARARCGRTQKVISGELQAGGYLVVELPGATMAALHGGMGGER